MDDAGLPFVGRAAELARLDEARHQTTTTGPVLVLIAGEPGFGKTRLALEVARTSYAGGAKRPHGPLR